MSETSKKTAMLRRLEKLLDRVRSSARAKPQPSSGLDRRDFLRMGTLTGAAASLGGLSALPAAAAVDRSPVASAPSSLNEVTILELQARMKGGDLSAVELLNYYLRRIHLLDETGPGVNSIMELNPDRKSVV